MIKYWLNCLSMILVSKQTVTQVTDTIPVIPPVSTDTVLRIHKPQPIFYATGRFDFIL